MGGHYARISQVPINGKMEATLLKGEDANKDQSYFLCQVSSDALAKSIFPVGNLLKVLPIDCSHFGSLKFERLLKRPCCAQQIRKIVLEYVLLGREILEIL
jgi:hypothetical protein